MNFSKGEPIDNKVPSYYRDPVRFLEQLKTKSEGYWLKRGEDVALNLFQLMSERVPAYKDFLKKHKIRASQIKTIEDFKQVPTIDKDNYLRKYPLADLCWDGKLSKGWHVYSSTSGSTGEPFYFPRSNWQDMQYSLTAEMYLLNNFDITNKSTLYIDAFAMGAWIGGLFTYQAIKNVAERGKYPISIITPGTNKLEIIKAIKKLGCNYDQVIIGAYPPFAKDIVDEGILEGLKWKKFNLKFVFSAEAFSEEFRDYIAKKTNLKDIYSLTLNHYGTVDQGTIAHETPLSILIRRLALKNSELYHSIFSDIYKVPTLAQYLPEMFYFEEINGEIICSTFSGIPLVRYDLKDHGGVISLSQMKEKFTKHNLNLDIETKKSKIDKRVMNLPFVYVYERADLSVSLSGANIYPETIKKVILRDEFLKCLTGRFSMMVKNDKELNPYLEVNVELKPNIKKLESNIKNKLSRSIEKQLLIENSEYEVIHSIMKNRAIPKITLWPYGYEKYFKIGGKQRWVIK